jgi:hypothetical protein
MIILSEADGGTTRICPWTGVPITPAELARLASGFPENDGGPSTGALLGGKPSKPTFGTASPADACPNSLPRSDRGGNVEMLAWEGIGTIGGAIVVRAAGNTSDGVVATTWGERPTLTRTTTPIRQITAATSTHLSLGSPTWWLGVDFTYFPNSVPCIAG